MRLFEDARQYLDTEALREARDEAAAMSLAKISIVPGVGRDARRQGVERAAAGRRRDDQRPASPRATPSS